MTPFETISVTIGAGGAAGGSVGGLSKFANLISFGGGTAGITANSLVNVQIASATSQAILNNSARPIVVSTPSNTYMVIMSTQVAPKPSGGVVAYTISQTAKPGAGGAASVAGSSGTVLLCY